MELAFNSQILEALQAEAPCGLPAQDSSRQQKVKQYELCRMLAQTLSTGWCAPAVLLVEDPHVLPAQNAPRGQKQN